jgi:hypothetical protein
MGITLFTLRELIASLRSLMNWLLHAATHASSTPEPRQPSARSASSRQCPSWPARAAVASETPRRPLRVVRVVDGSCAPTRAGRMFMSGRMADVCAELDRLAALEAAAAG